MVFYQFSVVDDSGTFGGRNCEHNHSMVDDSGTLGGRNYEHSVLGSLHSFSFETKCYYAFSSGFHFHSLILAYESIWFPSAPTHSIICKTNNTKMILIHKQHKHDSLSPQFPRCRILSTEIFITLKQAIPAETNIVCHILTLSNIVCHILTYSVIHTPT
jgi:hypothetical protein